ncbi:hypothetical protein L226DRAFT_553696 [Lentinus tigrinus ALCF2SS1-7]|uniref:Senescence domain-containing protein n=1 Tax=Lentinus tigrinus ALCF2SS1-6 TaxID=1328759 RepID=A0A5C2S626_9APHY|nr:hypothetical protein L227DRAFT_601570 [Lentinus tigrinus ALCF2SS1-6]RPD73591.1 hypothetical protein L226DRAFT_553696 [Lentinus tigrinus ALCF2SS1-7]
MSTHPEAFVLLHIPEVTLSTATASESGTLALECVTLASNDGDKDAALAASLSPSDRSLILVLHLGSLELPLDPARSISLHIEKDGARTYTFHSDTPATPADQEPSFIRLTVPIPSKPDPHRAETVEALDHILGQYAEFDWHADTHEHAPQAAAAPAEQSTQDLRGKLVLMDEQTGEVVGELPNKVNIKEDPALADETKGKDGQPAPVMLEMPPDVYDAYTGAGTSVVPYADESSELDEAREIFVRAIPPEDQDWMTKSATLISQAISSSTSLLLSGFTSATNYYISHSTPAQTQTSKDGTPPPPPSRALLLLSHPRTHQTLSHAYAISGQAVKVSAKTVGIVEDLIKRAVGGSDKGKTVAAPQPVQPRPQPSTTPSAQSIPSVSLDVPPPYPGSSPTPDGKPPLPPRRNATPGAAPSPGPAPPLPPRSKSPQPGSQAATPPAPASGTSTPGKPVGTKEKLLLSANLILSAVDDSIKRTFDAGSESVSAVVAHKYGPEAGRSTHLATHTARNVTLVYIDMRGFARKALIKKAGKHWLKARVGGGKEMSGLVVDKQEQAPKN